MNYMVCETKPKRCEDDDTTELNICSGCIYENIDDTTDAISTCVCCSRKVDFAKYDYYMR